MKTLTLQQAADLLKLHPVTLQGKAKAGLIPCCKIGRRWVFVDIDLIEHIRAQYNLRALEGEHERKQICHSTNAKTQQFGGLKSLSLEKCYKEALGLTTKSKPKNSMTN